MASLIPLVPRLGFLRDSPQVLGFLRDNPLVLQQERE
jgi:hypothetical protein